MTDIAIARSLSEECVVAETSLPRWPFLQRRLFRFVCCYFVLYCLPEPGRINIFGSIPEGGLLYQPYVGLWHQICPWVAIHVFHLSGKPTTYFPTGSGDTTLAYIENLLYILFALAGAVVWSLLDRRRPDYRRLHCWLRLLVRYTLALTMFGYGFAKVFPLQFQPASFARLIQPYGEFSPMGVLWSFMGASLPYVIFSGAMEVLGGLLLVFRRTTTLGALVSLGALLQVAALNFCYDVPVKLYSVNLVLMCVFLVAPDLRRLANVLVFNRAAPPADLLAPRFDRLWMRRAVTAVWVLFVGYTLFSNIQGGWTAYKEIYVHPPRPSLYGLYEAERFVRNGEEVPALVTDATRWHKVAVNVPQFMSIQMMDDSTKYYGTAYDANKKTLTLNQDVLTWSQPDTEHVALEGKLGSDTVLIRLRKIDTAKFTLINRGFHWINEMPFNR